MRVDAHICVALHALVFKVRIVGLCIKLAVRSLIDPSTYNYRANCGLTLYKNKTSLFRRFLQERLAAS